MKLEAELQKVYDGILAPMDKNLIPSGSTGESEVFYHEMKGDYNGHFAEFATCVCREPHRRGCSCRLCWISIFQREVLQNPDETCETVCVALKDAKTCAETPL